LSYGPRTGVKGIIEGGRPHASKGNPWLSEKGGGRGNPRPPPVVATVTSSLFRQGAGTRCRRTANRGGGRRTAGPGWGRSWPLSNRRAQGGTGPWPAPPRSWLYIRSTRRYLPEGVLLAVVLQVVVAQVVEGPGPSGLGSALVADGLPELGPPLVQVPLLHLALGQVHLDVGLLRVGGVGRLLSTASNFRSALGVLAARAGTSARQDPRSPP